MTGKTLAIVLAGGTGARMGADKPKQLMRLNGRTLLERSIAPFEASGEVDEILVMMAPGAVDEAEDIVSGAGFKKVVGVAPGGASRRATTFAALNLAPAGTERVLVHDAARPLVSAGVLRRCLEALANHDAVSPVVAATDTIYRVKAEGAILEEVCRRDEFRMAQTPQAFRLELLLRAHQFADRDTYETATDDCGIVAQYFPEVAIHLVEGDVNNIKVTMPADLAVADVLETRTQR